MALPLGLAVGGADRPDAHAERLAWVDRAEALGMHSVWLPEGHFSRGASASPLVVLAAFAARTRRLRLGTTSLLISIHHPLRVAEEVSVLEDSGRRLSDIAVFYRTNAQSRVIEDQLDRMGDA